MWIFFKLSSAPQVFNEAISLLKDKHTQGFAEMRKLVDHHLLPKDGVPIGCSFGKTNDLTAAPVIGDHEICSDPGLAKGKSKVDLELEHEDNSLKDKLTQAFAEMRKLINDPPPKDTVTIGCSFGKTSELTATPITGDQEICSDPGLAKGKSKVFSELEHQDNDVKLESIPENGSGKKNPMYSQPSSMIIDQKTLDLDLSLSPPGSGNHGEHNKKVYSSSPSKSLDVSKESNDEGAGFTQDDTQHDLVLMSCRNCFLHVMVSEVDPKCPNCRKKEFLLDIFCDSPLKNAKLY